MKRFRVQGRRDEGVWALREAKLRDMKAEVRKQGSESREPWRQEKGNRPG